jgi:hypothetical protein
MADSNNSGQFGNRSDTKKQAATGGKASTGSFGDKNSANPSKAGKLGADAQPREAKAEGGRNSHRGGNS